MTFAERWQYVRDERARGRSYRDLARELGVDRSRVVQIAKQAEQPGRDTRPTEIDPAKPYGMLTFLSPAPTPPGKKGRHGRFRCECGTECVIDIAGVVRGNNTACGCQAYGQSNRRRNWPRTCATCQNGFLGAVNAKYCGPVCRGYFRTGERTAGTSPTAEPPK